MKAKVHPHALYSSVELDSRYAPRIVAFPRHDNDGTLVTGPFLPEGPSISAGIPGKLAAAPEATQLAAAALQLYIHEAGEHITIPGINLNQHYAGGLEMAAHLLREYVVPWLEEAATRVRALPPAPEYIPAPEDP